MLTESDSSETLHNITHVILDEVHERDLSSDFLMLVITDILEVNSDIRLILMSATMQTQLFSNYYQSCPILEIPGQMFQVEEYYLEDILKEIGYQCQQSERIKQLNGKPRISRYKRDQIEFAIENFVTDSSDDAAI
eukprot:TRINITY_DN15236_c0_g2_i1.p1 TRINITY_DN15236_c0_g2~~TRINITY_DN15236_c0_g2_i1.p1  ORF type:complete len:136 (+),score=9.45 TRINITY_DN15236_c0_g2_i1:367-774(+)